MLDMFSRYFGCFYAGYALPTFTVSSSLTVSLTSLVGFVFKMVL
jgi:hypothetical protein